MAANATVVPVTRMKTGLFRRVGVEKVHNEKEGGCGMRDTASIACIACTGGRGLAAGHGMTGSLCHECQTCQTSLGGRSVARNAPPWLKHHKIPQPRH